MKLRTVFWLIQIIPPLLVARLSIWALVEQGYPRATVLRISFLACVFLSFQNHQALLYFTEEEYPGEHIPRNKLFSFLVGLFARNFSLLLGGGAVCLILKQGVGSLTLISTRAQLALIYLGAGLGYVAMPLLSRPQRQILRGRAMLSQRRAHRKTDSLLTSTTDPGLYFGNVDVPSRAALTHAAFLGTTGSGKTLSITAWKKGLLAARGTGQCIKAVIYDNKMDEIPRLVGMGIPLDQIIITNPFDARCSRWAVEKDCTSETSCRELAQNLIPTDAKEANPFFPGSARGILTNVALSLHLSTPYQWTFADLFLAIKTPQRVEHFLSRHTETSFGLTYLQKEGTFADIHATLEEKVSRYRALAALWQKAETSFSITEWVPGSDETILLLGNRDSRAESMQVINRLLFKKLSQEALDLPDLAQGEGRRLYALFDEVQEMGMLSDLPRWLTRGRSRGCGVTLGFQLRAGLTRAFGGKEIVEEMLSQCGHRAFLRPGSIEDAEWISRLIGQTEELVPQESVTEAARGGSRTRSDQKRMRQSVLAGELMEIPSVELGALHGFYESSYIGAWRGRIQLKAMLKEIPKPCPMTPGFIWRTDEEEKLQEWSHADAHRLNIPLELLAPVEEDRPDEPRLHLTMIDHPLREPQH